MKSNLWVSFFIGVYLLGPSIVNASLVGRLETSPGSGVFQAYYDDQLNITWAADANINGSDTWRNQMAWAVGLTIGGVSGWRLPSMDINGDGVVVECPSVSQSACADNEYSHLFWYGAGTTLGSGVTASNPRQFDNVLFKNYWSSADNTGTITNHAWRQSFSSGNKGVLDKGSKAYAWAVYPGDVAAVPLPGAVWLFLSGLIGVVGVSRKSARYSV